MNDAADSIWLNRNPFESVRLQSPKKHFIKLILATILSGWHFIIRYCIKGVDSSWPISSFPVLNKKIHRNTRPG